MARRGMRYEPNGWDEDRPVAPRSVPRWWRGTDPDPAVVDRLCVQEGRTETEIAVLLSISRPRVATVLRNAGIPRRNSLPGRSGHPRRDGGPGWRDGVTAVARNHEVSHATAARWFTEAGLLGADPAVDPGQLRELYVARQLTCAAWRSEVHELPDHDRVARLGVVE